MKILRAYKVELKPNNAQRSLFQQAAGCARWAYNWGLRKKIDAFAARKAAIAANTPVSGLPKTPTAIDLHKQLNILKKAPKEDGGVPWMYKSSKSAPQNALRNLDKAFDNFFRKCKKKTKGPKGFPRFKSKKNGIGTFQVETTHTSATHIQLPRIGSVRLKEHDYIPTDGSIKILSVVVSEKAGRWFASVQVEQEVPEVPDTTGLPVVGVDVGISELATCSDTRGFANPKALTNGLKKLKRLQRKGSHKPKGSNNRRKATVKVSKQHYRISCIRKDAMHKTSNAITKHCSVIGLEDLNVEGMKKNRKLALAVSDASMSELHRQIRYKAAWRCVRIHTVGRWYPSTKQCSNCHEINHDITLKDRIFHCPRCGLRICRNLNAAINLEHEAVSSTVTACGVEGADKSCKRLVKPAMMKQEINTDQDLSLIGSV